MVDITAIAKKEPRTGEIETSLNLLCDVILSLETQVDNLLTKISPVCRSDDPPNEARVATPTTCDISDLIYKRVDHIQDITDKISQKIDKIEL